MCRHHCQVCRTYKFSLTPFLILRSRLAPSSIDSYVHVKCWNAAPRNLKDTDDRYYSYSKSCRNNAAARSTEYWICSRMLLAGRYEKNSASSVLCEYMNQVENHGKRGSLNLILLRLDHCQKTLISFNPKNLVVEGQCHPIHSMRYRHCFFDADIWPKLKCSIFLLIPDNDDLFRVGCCI